MTNGGRAAVAVVLALILSLALAACGGSDEETTAAGGEEEGGGGSAIVSNPENGKVSLTILSRTESSSATAAMSRGVLSNRAHVPKLSDGPATRTSRSARS